ncbi:MAG: cytochrome C oxidase subunit IV family protein [Candidatus Latescibacterota bacterium]|nr:cytochrome C oxidase subunit IV family protein [Candidatus Latescibacterota bacterium]
MANHVVPVKMYVTIVGCLFFLTMITVLAAFVELGVLNTPLALGIALLKATLVVLFFMHVRYNTPLMWVFAAAGFFMVLIFLALLMQDYMSRDWERPPAEFLL